jgi:LPS-assembly protein
LFLASLYLFSASGLFAQAEFAPPPPAKDETQFAGVTQTSEGSIKHLRGQTQIRTSAMLITADEMDYDQDTDWVKARGHVTLEHYVSKDKIKADRAEYNLKTRNGKFYQVSGTSPAKIMTSPGVLTTTNPFYFEAQWADRLDDRYILHHGFITDCKLPKPWWTFRAPVFDVIPDDRAIGHQTVFRLKTVPIFYLPYFYRPLGKNPRKSGFLTPEIGHSSRFGYIYGGGYYWAISPSYDMTGRVQYMTERGPAFLYDFRGKPNQVTDFDFNLYGVNDSGYQNTPSQGGLDYQLRATTEVWGFQGRLDFNYLSSLLFREVFSYSFNNAIYNQVDSIGSLQRRFKDDQYTLTFAAQRSQIFEALTNPHVGQAANEVILDKLPSVEFNGRERNLVSGPVPLWFSFDASASLLSRKDPSGIETAAGPPQSQFTSGPYGRLDLQPHAETNFLYHGFSLTPGLTLAATDYTNSYSINSTTYLPSTSCSGFVYCPVVTEQMAAANLFRKDADFRLDFRTPALEHIYAPPKWMHLGEKLKHVIEAEADYEYVTGINQFQRTVQYDETDILSNTNQVTVRLTNRIFRKNKKGDATEVFSWRIAQARYFDPTFGGAVLGQQPGSVAPGYRNVVFWSADLTPYPFLDGPRHYSPVVSSMTVNPYSFLTLDWRTDYDPKHQKFVDQTYTANFRHKNLFASVGQTSLTNSPVLVPQENQINFGAGYGSSTRKGWNFAGNVSRDVLRSFDTFETIQAAYNTDCCGFSMRYQRINFGARQDENQYLFSFSVANIGTFGSQQRQQRVF